MLRDFLKKHVLNINVNELIFDVITLSFIALIGSDAGQMVENFAVEIQHNLSLFQSYLIASGCGIIMMFLLFYIFSKENNVNTLSIVLFMTS